MLATIAKPGCVDVTIYGLETEVVAGNLTWTPLQVVTLNCKECSNVTLQCTRNRFASTFAVSLPAPSQIRSCVMAGNWNEGKRWQKRKREDRDRKRAKGVRKSEVYSPNHQQKVQKQKQMSDIHIKTKALKHKIEYKMKNRQKINTRTR